MNNSLEIKEYRVLMSDNSIVTVKANSEFNALLLANTIKLTAIKVLN